MAGTTGDRAGSGANGGVDSGHRDSAADGPGAIRGRRAGEAPVPLSILDLAAVGSGSSAAEAVGTSALIARAAEERGYHRFWVAEHHGMPGVASSSPAVLLAHLAAHTERIRLGSGGVMLPNHAPLVIAEQFGTLEALAPGRIDLGLGRAPGTDGATAAALRRTERIRTDADDFPQALTELLHFLDDDFPDGHRYARLHAVPGPVQGSAGRPPVWLLGSSGFSAELAGRMGLPFAFAHHFAGTETGPALELYRASFRPSPALAQPYALIGVSALAAEDEKEAYRQVRTGAVAMMMLRRGRPGLVPTPDEAEAFPLSAAERELVERMIGHVLHGTPDVVRDSLNVLAERTGADELMLTTTVHTPAARLRSYRLIADAYGMPAARR